MVSIVIPTYDRPEKMICAVKSALQQSCQDIEIIVVDDNGRGSKAQNETEQCVRTIDDPRIRYIVHDKNQGGCAARNTGIENARGSYIAFLDDDDVWSKAFIETMIPLFTDDKIGAVYCDFYSYDGVYSITKKNRTCFSGNVYRQILSGWCPASTSLFIVRKECFETVGGFDQDLQSFQD